MTSKPHDGEASRDRILALVERDPGIHVTEIAAHTGMAWHTTSYHLSRLVESGQVAMEKNGRDRCVFPKSVPARERPWLLAMRADLAPELLRVLLADPRQDIAALSARLGRSEKVVRRRIERLAEVGVVVRVGTWRPVYEVRPAATHRIASLLAHSRHHPSAGLVGSWEWDPRGNQPEMSKDSLLILGLAQRDGPSCESLVDFVHPHDRPGLTAAMRLTVLDGQAYDHTVRMRTPRGERHIRHRGWVSARSPNGKASRLSVTLEDVTGPSATRHSRPEPGAHAAARRPEPDQPGGQFVRRFLAGLLGKTADPASARGPRRVD